MSVVPNIKLRKAHAFRYYSIGYAIVSLIFITSAIGFISAVFIVDVLRARLGRARTLMVSQALLATGLVMIVCTPPFPVVVASFFFIGLGEAIYLASTFNPASLRRFL